MSGTEGDANLAAYPVVPERGVDVVAPARRSRRDVSISRGGSLLLSPEVIQRLRWPAVVLWKYLGADGFNIIEADDWDRPLGALYSVEAPRVDRGEHRYRIRIPERYVVALRCGDAPFEISIHGGRAVLSVMNCIDPHRLYRAW